MAKLKKVEYKGNMTQHYPPGSIRVDWVLEGFKRRENDQEMRRFAENVTLEEVMTHEAEHAHHEMEVARFDGGY